MEKEGGLGGIGVGTEGSHKLRRIAAPKERTPSFQNTPPLPEKPVARNMRNNCRNPHVQLPVLLTNHPAQEPLLLSSHLSPIIQTQRTNRSPSGAFVKGLSAMAIAHNPQLAPAILNFTPSTTAMRNMRNNCRNPHVQLPVLHTNHPTQELLPSSSHLSPIIQSQRTNRSSSGAFVKGLSALAIAHNPQRAPVP